MTVNKLYELLHKLVITGHGRKPVYVDKPSFQHNCESDGCVIQFVAKAGLQTFAHIDDDGGVAVRADGSERTITALVLQGEAESSFPTSDQSHE